VKVWRNSVKPRSLDALSNGDNKFKPYQVNYRQLAMKKAGIEESD